MTNGRILITGGAGYIGSHLVWSLFEAGERPVVLDNLSTGDLRNLPGGVDFYEGDAGDSRLVRDILISEKITTVIHFAGSLIVEESMRDPLKYYINNTLVTALLLKACAGTHVKNFVFSSTAAVYGQNETFVVDESVQLKPISPYGESKRMAEKMIEDSCRANSIRFACLRYFNVAGVHPRLRSGPRSDESSHLIRRACWAALGRLPSLDVFGNDYETPDGTCVRDFIHVADLTDAHLEAVKYLEQNGESIVLNCGYGRGRSVMQVVEAVETLSKTQLALDFAPRRSGDISALVADTGLMSKRLPNWKPQFTELSDTIATALAWEKKLLLERSREQSHESEATERDFV